MAGVMPRAWARANSASRVLGSSQCQRRVLLTDPRPPVVGRAGGSGSCGLRLCFFGLDGLAVLPVGVAQVGQLPAHVEGRQVGHQGAIAHRIGGLHVQIDVQPGAFGR
jgi:hypothetical protein